MDAKPTSHSDGVSVGLQLAQLKTQPLPVSKLRKRCLPASFDFKSTAQLEPLNEPIGQQRALEAIDFGLDMKSAGYNLYLQGAWGTGRHATANRLLGERAKQEASPSDWVYVNDFDDIFHPRLLQFAAGQGKVFAEAVRQALKDIQTSIVAVFEQQENRRRLGAIEEEFQLKQEEALEEIGAEARTVGIALLRTPRGFAFAPTKEEGVISPEEYAQMPEGDRDKVEEHTEALHKSLKVTLEKIPTWAREKQKAIRSTTRELTELALEQPITQLIDRWKKVDKVEEFLKQMQENLVDQIESSALHDRGSDDSDDEGPAGPADAGAMGSGGIVSRYGVHAFVSHEVDASAPVIYEDHPTYGRLFGEIEHHSQFGGPTADIRLMKAGSLHRANGGYLIVDAEKLLSDPFSYRALKRALKSSKLSIESEDRMLQLSSAVQLQPDPIPLDLKVVLCGSPTTYDLLCELDPEFEDLFKVVADFADRIDRTEENCKRFARLVATFAGDGPSCPLDRSAVARILDESSRMADDQKKLSVRLTPIRDLIRETQYMATKTSAELATAEHVRMALAARVKRHDSVRERIYESVVRKKMRIDTHGLAVGRLNGLSVLAQGKFRFGLPMRISASVRPGSGRLVDIEREVNLGGPLHTKGVLILSGFLASKLSSRVPLCFGASLVFEQSYGMIDGDSASAAELCTLVSALGDIPLRQALAVTGSISQGGEIQAIGGVNEKVEGYFDICRAQGLARSGEQGVVIPKANIDDLMLRDDVVQAVEEGLFHVYAVETVDELLELLTLRQAGSRDSHGRFPKGSVFAAVETRLNTFVDWLRSHRGEKGPGDE